MGKKRIYEVAKEYGKSTNEVLDLLKRHNIEKSNFSAVDDSDLVIIDKEYNKKPPVPAKKEVVKKEQPVNMQKQQVKKPEQNGMNKNVPQHNQNTRSNEGKMQQRNNNNNRNNQNAQQNRSGQAAHTDNRKNQEAHNRQQRFGNNAPKNQPARNNDNRNAQGNAQHNRPNFNNGASDNRNNRNNNFNNKNNRKDKPQIKGSYATKESRPNRSAGHQMNRKRPANNAPKNQPARNNDNRNAQGNAQHNRPNFNNGASDNRNNRNNNFNNKNNRKDKPQIKGSYATKESRPNRSAGHQMNRKRPANNAPKVQQPVVEVPKPTYVEIGESINVKEFASLIKREVNEVIKALFMLGVMVTINQDIDYDTAQLIGEEFGVEVGQKAPDEDPTEVPEVEDDPAKRLPRPPVITVMGHVDHGKTSLLDAIRKTNVTAREAGGITQHIGAYKVNYQGKQIVFLDTPGHEAFTAMRARGAQVTDVAILVVAADDGVMPQTIEAINHAKAAKVPIIVAINKIDRPGANPDHVKQQLAEHELIPEDWGGDTIMVPVSAHQKTGISDLLEMILLVAEMQELKANPNLPAHGTIIEAQLDKGRGPVATVLVQRGTLHIGDTIIAGTAYGKVRAMINDRGEKVKKALPSTPVEVLGLNDVPQAGDILDSTDEKTARSVAEKRIAKKREEEIQVNSKVSLDDLFQRIQEGELKELNIVVKADVQGTIEALKASLQKIKNEEVKVVVVHAGVGSITESDVMLASAANALIIGFNVRPDANARKASETEKVDVRTYRVIYDALNDVEAAIKGMLAPKFKEVIQGRVEVRQLITISKLLIAGCYVLEGKVTNSSKVRVVRDGIVVHEGEIESLRRFKDDVKEVAQGFECGITLDKFRDLKEGDIFEIYNMEEIKEE